jgi:hypothetical protein
MVSTAAGATGTPVGDAGANAAVKVVSTAEGATGTPVCDAVAMGTLVDDFGAVAADLPDFTEIGMTALAVAGSPATGTKILTAVGAQTAALISNSFDDVEETPRRGETGGNDGFELHTQNLTEPRSTTATYFPET